MSQAGFTPISIYYSATASAVPLAANLVAGELALNTNDGKLYYKNASNVVTLLAGATSGPAGGSNTQVQFNSSGVLAGSANMTFNGTILTAAGFSGPLNGTVGATTPAAGSFTSLDYSTTLTGGTGIVNLGSGQFYKDASGNVGIGNTAANVNDQVGAVRPLLVSKSDAATTVAGSQAAIVIGNSDTTTSNTSQLSFAAITGASATYFTSAAINCIFGARTNAQYPTGQLTFSTSTTLNSAPTEKMRINSSGNVGIGTSSPAYKLEVRSTMAVLDGSANIGFWANGTSYTQVWQTLQSVNDFTIQTAASKYMSFGTNSTERMRIDSSGNVIVGNTAQFGSGKFNIFYTPGTTTGASFLPTTDASTPTPCIFLNAAGTAVGSIVTGPSSTGYNTSSDYRLKEDIAPMTGALEKVALLKPRTYKWKVDGSDGQGFIAHELQAVVPECVSGEKDAVDADGNPKYQGVDTSFLVATLTAAIQEQQALITSLTARIAALEAK